MQLSSPGAIKKRISWGDSLPNIIDFSDTSIHKALEVGAFIGAVKNMPNNVYHGLKTYWSSTQLKYLYANSPTHFYEEYFPKHEKEQKEPSDAMKLGSLTHCLLLDAKTFEKDFAIMPSINLRTNEGKAAKEEFKAKNQGKIFIDDDLLLKANAMAVSCMKNEEAKNLLTPDHREIAFFWKCPLTNLNFKAKADQACSKHLVELKTTKDASPDGFLKQAIDMHYDLSIRHYLEGIKNIFEIDVPARVIAVETEFPLVTQVYNVHETFVMTGHAKWIETITKLELCLRTNNWPGYSSKEMGIPELQSPPWLLNKLGVNYGI